MFLTDKPWLTTGVIGTSDNRSDSELSRDQAWSGFKLLLCVLTMLFFIMVTAYLLRMDIADWKRLNEPWLLWFNTGTLLLCSIAMAKAQQAVKQNHIVAMKMAFICAGVLTLIFLVGQLLVWQHYSAMGFYLASNPANTFFYMVTAIHGLHLVVGLIFWSTTTIKLLCGVNSSQLRLSIELCVMYWHFLLLVWYVLFGLLIVT